MVRRGQAYVISGGGDGKDAPRGIGSVAMFMNRLADEFAQEGFSEGTYLGVPLDGCGQWTAIPANNELVVLSF